MTQAIHVFGEGMLELSGSASDRRLGYGGDALNTAMYLARLGAPVEFVTALGGDPFSRQARRDWSERGISLNHCLEAPDKVMGLYAIHVDESGERSFTYWRGQSAARDFFNLAGADIAERAVHQADVLYFSLISISVLDGTGQARLVAAAHAVHARGGVVAFDTNFRRQGWSDLTLARSAIEAIMPHVTLALPSAEDHEALYGERNVDACLAAWRDAGVGEIVVKDGANGCLLFAQDNARWMQAEAVQAVDTTGAGDSFNAGYLAARLKGLSPETSCRDAQTLAAKVVLQHGAIVST